MNDKRHGYGVCKYPSGDEYEGQWHEGERHGKGVLRYGSTGNSGEAVEENEKVLHSRSGDMYEGSFEYNEPHGMGRYTYHSGQVGRSRVGIAERMIGIFRFLRVLSAKARSMGQVSGWKRPQGLVH